jgi:hypothetical protein
VRGRFDLPTVIDTSAILDYHIQTSSVFKDKHISSCSGKYECLNSEQWNWCSELSSGMYCRILIPDDGGSTYLWNVGRQLFCTAVHPRRQFWTSHSPPWELEISQVKLSTLFKCKVKNTQSFTRFWVYKRILNWIFLCVWVLIAVTGYCYEVVSYKASHATATICWSIVLPVWILINPKISSRVLGSGCSRDI